MAYTVTQYMYIHTQNCSKQYKTYFDCIHNWDTAAFSYFRHCEKSVCSFYCRRFCQERV